MEKDKKVTRIYIEEESGIVFRAQFKLSYEQIINFEEYRGTLVSKVDEEMTQIWLDYDTVVILENFDTIFKWWTKLRNEERSKENIYTKN